MNEPKNDISLCVRVSEQVSVCLQEKKMWTNTLNMCVCVCAWV